MVEIFPRFGEELKPGMREGILDRDRPPLLSHQARQPLVKAHANPADAFGFEPHGGAEDKLATFGLKQIDRADVRMKASLNQLDDVRQRLAGAVAVRDEIADLLEREKERTFMLRCGRYHLLSLTSYTARGRN